MGAALPLHQFAQHAAPLQNLFEQKKYSPFRQNPGCAPVFIKYSGIIKVGLCGIVE